MRQGYDRGLGRRDPDSVVIARPHGRNLDGLICVPTLGPRHSRTETPSMTSTRRALLSLVPLVSAGLVAGIGLASVTAAAPEQLVLRDLDRGPAPSVPYIARGVVVDGDTRVDVPGNLSRLVGRIGEDYLLQGFERRSLKEVVVRVTPDGARTTLVRASSLSDATLSPDGTNFLASRAGNDARTILRRYDAATGDVTMRREVRGYARVLDYDGSRAVVGVTNPAKTVTWNLTTNAVSTLVRQTGYRADLPTDRLARFTKDIYRGGCTVVSTISRPDRPLWESCDEAVTAFSTDGSRVATVHILTDGLGPGRFTLRKTTGRRLAVYEAPYYFGRIWFEDATRVLVDTFSRNAGAVVRCDGAGCERATRVFRHEAPLRPARATGGAG
jgi:hypothetical protein